jgi:hypothetical protein
MESTKSSSFVFVELKEQEKPAPEEHKRKVLAEIQNIIRELQTRDQK